MYQLEFKYSLGLNAISQICLLYVQRLKKTHGITWATNNRRSGNLTGEPETNTILNMNFEGSIFI